jgi:hypothetical protein
MIVIQPDSYPELSDLSGRNVLLSTTYHGEDIITTPPCTVIYSQIGEYLTEDRIHHLIRTQSERNYYIFLSPHDISEEVIYKFKDCAIFIHLKNAYAYYSNHLKYQNINFNKIFNTPKTHYFLSLNNRASWPRQGLFYFFQKYELLDKAYFSYHGEINRTPYNSLTELDSVFFLDKTNKTWYTEGLNFSKAKTLIPFSTISDNFSNNCWSFGNDKYYTDCFCSVVMETYCFEQYAYFTEKTFKPLAFYQPFFIHGNVGCLKKLQNMGFKTFSNWWDESYDKLFDHKRFEAMLRVILEVSTWSLEKINDVYLEMMPVLEHNHNHFTKVLPELYNAEIAQVKNQIVDIIKSQS